MSAQGRAPESASGRRRGRADRAMPNTGRSRPGRISDVGARAAVVPRGTMQSPLLAYGQHEGAAGVVVRRKGKGITMQGVMIVTGGSQGIGAAIARLAGARGYAVALTYQTSRSPAEAITWA